MSVRAAAGVVGLTCACLALALEASAKTERALVVAASPLACGQAGQITVEAGGASSELRGVVALGPPGNSTFVAGGLVRDQSGAARPAIWEFRSRGPRTFALKPDIAAPGTQILSGQLNAGKRLSDTSAMFGGSAGSSAALYRYNGSQLTRIDLPAVGTASAINAITGTPTRLIVAGTASATGPTRIFPFAFVGNATASPPTWQPITLPTLGADTQVAAADSFGETTWVAGFGRNPPAPFTPYLVRITGGTATLITVPSAFSLNNGFNTVVALDGRTALAGGNATVNAAGDFTSRFGEARDFAWSDYPDPYDFLDVLLNGRPRGDDSIGLSAAFNYFGDSRLRQSVERNSRVGSRAFRARARNSIAARAGFAGEARNRTSPVRQDAFVFGAARSARDARAAALARRLQSPEQVTRLLSVVSQPFTGPATTRQTRPTRRRLGKRVHTLLGTVQVIAVGRAGATTNALENRGWASVLTCRWTVKEEITLRRAAAKRRKGR